VNPASGLADKSEISGVGWICPNTAPITNRLYIKKWTQVVIEELTEMYCT